jgi:hypothetical protein
MIIILLCVILLFFFNSIRLYYVIPNMYPKRIRTHTKDKLLNSYNKFIYIQINGYRIHDYN